MKTIIFILLTFWAFSAKSQIINKTLTADYSQIYEIGKYSYDWSCQAVWNTYSVGTALDGVFSIYVSDDKINWSLYSSSFHVTLDTSNFVVSGTDTLSNQPFADKGCEFQWLKFEVIMNTIDTIDFRLYLTTKTKK